jgi:hypothetical protein
MKKGDGLSKGFNTKGLQQLTVSDGSSLSQSENTLNIIALKLFKYGLTLWH